MSDQDYIYGVFAETEHVAAAVTRLHEAGLKTSEICVLVDDAEQFQLISGKIEDPTAKYFMWFGVAGAIAGLIAGIFVSLHIPGINGFQLIVPLMGTVSGGACFPYVICQLSTFLTSNKPQHWAHVFAGSVKGGQVIVMAEPQSFEQRTAAMNILLEYNPSDLIVRKAQWGVSVTSTPVPAREAATQSDHSNEKERRLTAVA